MESKAPGSTTSRSWERFLAMLCAIVCLVITLRIWQVIGSQQYMWPLPGLYLVEMLSLSAAVSVAVFREARFAGAIAWTTLGAMSAFAVLAAFTIGFLYLPVIVLIAIVGGLLVRRSGLSLFIHAALFLIAAAAQSAVIFAAIRILYPGAAF